MTDPGPDKKERTKRLKKFHKFLENDMDQKFKLHTKAREFEKYDLPGAKEKTIKCKLEAQAVLEEILVLQKIIRDKRDNEEIF